MVACVKTETDKPTFSFPEAVLFLNSYVSLIGGDNESARNNLKISPATRAHTLYPVLDYLARSVHSQETRLEEIKKDVASIKSELTELHQLQKEQNHKSFDLKNSPYMVSASQLRMPLRYMYMYGQNQYTSLHLCLYII